MLYIHIPRKLKNIQYLALGKEFIFPMLILEVKSNSGNYFIREAIASKKSFLSPTCLQ